MKPLRTAFVLGIGFWMLSGIPARAQVGGMGETPNTGAVDAARQEVMKRAAEKAGLPAPAAPAAAPDSDTGAVAPGEPPVGEPPVGEPKVGEPKVAPGEAEAPTPTPGAGEATQDASGLGKNLPKLP